MKTVLLIFLMLIFFCRINAQFNQREEVTITKDNRVIEKLYFDNKKLPLAIVYYNKSLGNWTDIDSLNFSYENDIFSNLKIYHLTGSKYQERNANLLKNRFSQILENTRNCRSLYLLQSSYILITEFGDICNIESSILSDGKEANEAETSYKENDTSKVIELNDLNSRFNNLSPDIDSLFNQSLLTKLKLYISNNSITREQYFFEDGQLERKYIYLNGKLFEIQIIASYNNNKSKNLRKYYSYNQY
jgi:hypothetical protein